MSISTNNNTSYFEQLVENLGLDEPEIINYQSGAQLGGLTEEQANYIVSEYINGRPVYILCNPHDINAYFSEGNSLITNTTLEIIDDVGIGIAGKGADWDQNSSIFIALTTAGNNDNLI